MTSSPRANAQLEADQLLRMLAKRVRDEVITQADGPAEDEPAAALQPYADALGVLVKELFDLAQDELPETITSSDFNRFARMVIGEIPGESPLDRIERAFGMSETEMGKLFGISRQAISSWRHKGVPASRQAKVTTIARIADTLERNVLTDRIPAIVRTPATAYGGRTMLLMITDDDHAALLALLRTSFDWAATA